MVNFNISKYPEIENFVEYHSASTMEFLAEFNVMFAALLFIVLLALLILAMRYLCQDFAFVTEFIEN